MANELEHIRLLPNPLLVAGWPYWLLPTWPRLRTFQTCEIFDLSCIWDRKGEMKKGLRLIIRVDSWGWDFIWHSYSELAFLNFWIYLGSTFWGLHFSRSLFLWKKNWLRCIIGLCNAKIVPLLSLKALKITEKCLFCNTLDQRCPTKMILVATFATFVATKSLLSQQFLELRSKTGI